MAPVPALRVNRVNDQPVRPDGRYVLYWMIAARRTRSSFALQHALNRAAALGKPLVVLEALRVGYRWASTRHHRFVLDGMRDNARRFAATPVLYHAYIEPDAGHGHGLLEALAADAALVVTDEYPAFFLPKMVAAAGARLLVALEQVDGNGLLPLRAADKTFTAANHFRRMLQRELPRHLEAFPVEDPLAQAHELPPVALAPAITERWPAVPISVLDGPASDALLTTLPIDHAVPVVAYAGGEVAGRALLDGFVRKKLAQYGEARNEPEAEATSGLSPYLHWGHVSVHEVARRLFHREQWTVDKLAPRPTGSREGWWGLSPTAEAFIDELVTWREIGFNFCFLRADHDRWESLPEWARKTLDKHTSDDRPVLYERRTLESARTHDALWNAAQRQLVVEGRIHNYLRMLWAKKVLEWSETPREALDTLIELNNRWSVDGRDPSSYSGIFWCFGRYDRPWPPERPIFGTVRYMSSDNTAKKLKVKGYISRWTAT